MAFQAFTTCVGGSARARTTSGRGRVPGRAPGDSASLAYEGYPGYTQGMAKVLVSFDDMLLRRIDRAAKAGGKSRSAYLAELAESDGARGQGPGKTAAARGALRKLDRLFAEAPAADSTDAVRGQRDAR